MSTSARKPRTLPGLHDALQQRLGCLGLQPSDPILDLGCGTGAWMQRLAGMGFTDLTGVDRLAPAGASAWRFHQANLNDSGWADPLAETGALYSFITAIEVVEHLLNPQALFSSLERLLTPGGRALITTPNVMALENRLCFLLSGSLPAFHEGGDPTHVFPLTDVTLQRLLANHPGLQLTALESWPAEAGFRLSYFGNPALLRRLSRALKLWLPNPFPGDTLLIEITRR